MGSGYVEVNLFDNLMDYIHSYIDCNLCVPFFVVVSLYLRIETAILCRWQTCI